MKDHDQDDERIRALVQSVERDAPCGIEEKIKIAAQAPRMVHPRRLDRRPLLAIASASGAAAVLLGVLLMIPSRRLDESRSIPEIRTEFVIADKNITIIFIQKPDFPEFMAF